MWDACMALSIQQGLSGAKCKEKNVLAKKNNVLDDLRNEKSPLVIHVNGKFHSEEGLGVPEKLRQLNPDIKCKIVTVVPTPAFVDLDALQQLPGELWGHGDFVVLSNGKIPRSFESKHPV